tara:strand:+ start:1426 stop:1695 length:270 start_codon:yes stop_codon:yes gene_type:complete
MAKTLIDNLAVLGVAAGMANNARDATIRTHTLMKEALPAIERIGNSIHPDIFNEYISPETVQYVCVSGPVLLLGRGLTYFAARSVNRSL